MNVLLTGATGFIGSHLTRRLVRDGFQVCVLVRPDSKLAILPPEPSNLQVQVYDGSYASLRQALERAQPQLVIHLASLFITQHREDDVAPLLEANIVFPTLLLEAMSRTGVQHFVNTGTSWQHYQNQAYNPVNLYAASKQAFESLLAHYTEIQGLHAITLKLFDTYGPGDTRPKLFSHLRAAARSGKTLKMSPGEQLIDLVYIDDVVEAYLLATRRVLAIDAAETYAVSSGRHISLRQLVAQYAETTGRKLAIEWGGLPYRPREVMQPWGIYQLLPGWHVSVGLRQGIIAMERDPEIGGLLVESAG